MKKILKKFGAVLAVVGVIFGIMGAAPEAKAMSPGEAGLTTFGIAFKDGQVYDSTCEGNLFGMRPWYAGLSVRTSTNKCEVGTPATDDDMTTMIWMIVLNVMSDVMIAVGYVALGFIVYGGYLYMLSSGDPNKVAKGKKTITAAVIGLAIVLLATGIVNTILSIIGA